MTVHILITNDHVTITRAGSTWSYTVAPPADMTTIERAQMMARNVPGANAQVWHWGSSQLTIEHGHDLYSTLVLGIILGRAETARIDSQPLPGLIV